MTGRPGLVIRAVRAAAILLGFSAMFSLSGIPGMSGNQANSTRAVLQAEFPAAQILQTAVQFTPAEQKLLQQKARRKVHSLQVYKVQQGTNTLAYGFVDRHRVRSRTETLLILVNADTSVRRIDVLEFREPSEYKAPRRWLQSLYHKTINDRLRPGSDLSGISGATMTGQAVSQAVRMAVQAVAILQAR